MATAATTTGEATTGTEAAERLAATATTAEGKAATGKTTADNSR